MTARPESESFRTRLPTIDSRPPSLLRRAQRVVAYRELLSSLTRKEVKVRYKDSLLGFVWTLLNPLLYLVVFSVVFSGFLKANVPFYGIFLLSGLLAWNLFSNGLSAATTSITGNGALVQKVWFPREILPLSAVGSALVTFFFQFAVLALALMVFQRSPAWEYLPVMIPALAVALLWATALGLLLAGLNVLYRDIQHLLELLLLAWFWLTPIVYQYDFIGDSLTARFGTDRVAMFNPLVSVVTTMQRVIYNPEHAVGTDAAGGFDRLLRPASWYLENLAASAAAGLVVLLFASWVFGRLEANLGEEI